MQIDLDDVDVSGFGPRDGFGAAVEAAGGLRGTPAPHLGNTGGVISHNRESLGDGLLAPGCYLPFKGEEEERKKHWSACDPETFAKVCQGGGGVDWIDASIVGSINERGQELVRKLKACKDALQLREPEQVVAEMGLRLLSWKFRHHMVIEHPGDDGDIRLGMGHYGAGRAFQPLVIQLHGITVKYGRIASSFSGRESADPVAAIEIPGTVFLRLGEVRAFALAERVCASLGISVDGVSCTRLDVCADLPGADIAEFVKCFEAGDVVTKAREGHTVRYAPIQQGGKPQTFYLLSGVVGLTIYDKLAEVATEKTGEKRKLMEQNRWGGGVDSAVRVEFRFKLSKSKTKRYKSLAELVEGLGDLIGWAMNTWCRFCHVTKVGKDHSSRAKIADCWLRTLHAFAWWSSKMAFRPEPPRVKSAPPLQLLRQAWGCIASGLGRAGLVPTDDFSVFELLAHWKGPNELAALCRKRAVEQIAARGLWGRNFRAGDDGDVRECGRGFAGDRDCLGGDDVKA